MKLTARTFRKIGWICFTLIWIPFVLLFVAMWDMPDGSYNFNELPRMAQYALLAMVILFPLVFFFLFIPIVFSKQSKKKLLINGIEAPAKIIRTYKTGTTVNSSYLLGFELEVLPKNSPKFRATVEQLIPSSKIIEYTSGDNVLVSFNPNSQEVMVIGSIKGELIS